MSREFLEPKVEIEEVKLTRIMNWEIAGYLPIEWICKKPYVSPPSWILSGMVREMSRNRDKSLLARSLTRVRYPNLSRVGTRRTRRAIGVSHSSSSHRLRFTWGSS